MDEWKQNLTFQALSKENDKVTTKFDYLAEVEEHQKLKLEISNKTIDT